MPVAPDHANVLESMDATLGQTPISDLTRQRVHTESHRRLYDGGFLLLALLPCF